LNGSSVKNVPEIWNIDYSDFLSSFKTALLFSYWIDEKTEDQIFDRYDIPPGELYNKIRNAEWMLYAYKELAVILDRKKIANKLNKLMLRIKHGVREDLLTLVMLKGIGRARARKLYNSNIRTVSELKKVDIKDLSRILGEKVAEKVREQLV